MSKSNMLEAMTAAYYESSTGNKWAVCTRGRESRRMHMRAALQAMLGQLKAVDEVKPDESDLPTLEQGHDFYQELLNMRGGDA